MELVIWEDPFDYEPGEDEFIDFIKDEEDIIELSCCIYSMYAYYG